jgi:hypothetical protein
MGIARRGLHAQSPGCTRPRKKQPTPSTGHGVFPRARRPQRARRRRLSGNDVNLETGEVQIRQQLQRVLGTLVLSGPQDVGCLTLLLHEKRQITLALAVAFLIFGAWTWSVRYQGCRARDFDAPVVSRVRIISGNTALGPNDNPGLGIDVAVMDDFIYAEPTATSVVPEPASLLLLGTGIASAGVQRWRKRRRVA